MAILRERQVWRRPKPAAPPRPGKLSPEQATHVRSALHVLRVRFGSWAAVAQAMPLSLKALEKALYGARQPTAAHALRVAQLAGAPVDDVLSGAWPKAGAWPMCGRCG